MTRLPLVVTPGDPRGIGPEVAIRALRTTGADAVLLGDVDALRGLAPDIALVDEIVPGRGLRALGLSPSAEPVEVAEIGRAHV